MRIKGQKNSSNWILILLFTFFYSLNSFAQCAMCRASLESSGDATKLEAINNGIVFLMIIPYILFGIVGIVVYRMFSKKRK